jgi:hypothetical protein
VDSLAASISPEADGCSPTDTPLNAADNGSCDTSLTTESVDPPYMAQESLFRTLPSLSKGALGLVRASACRIRALEDEATALRSQLQNHTQHLQTLAGDAMPAKKHTVQPDQVDSPTSAVKACHRGGSPPDTVAEAIAAHYHSEAQTDLVLELTKRNETLVAQLTAAQHAADPAMYDKAVRGREAAEARTAALAREKRRLAAEVEEMRSELGKLQREVEADASARVSVEVSTQRCRVGCCMTLDHALPTCSKK